MNIDDSRFAASVQPLTSFVATTFTTRLLLALFCLLAIPLTATAATVDPGATSQAFYYFVNDGAGSDALNGAVLNADGTLTSRLFNVDGNVSNGQIASSDGITWYSTFTSGTNVRLFSGPSRSSGSLSLVEINGNTGGPLNILDIATADQNTFFFLTTTNEVFSGVLQDDGSFVTTLITATADAPAGTFGFATSDGVTFYLAADDGTGTAAFYSATLSAAGLATTLLNADSGIPLEGDGLVAAQTAVELVNNGPVCPGERLIASPNNGYPLNQPDFTFMAFDWTGPDGFMSNEMNITVSEFSAANAGTYEVTITFPAGNTLVCSFEAALSTDCDEACDCETYAYVNDITNNITHKFEIQENGDFAEIGTPWLPFVDGEIFQPHGVSVDPNGFIYISELGRDDYVKLTCDGDIVDSEAEQVDGFNHVIIGGFMYILNNNRFVEVYELCDDSKSFVGFVELGEQADQPAGTANWGITFNPMDSMLYITDNYPNPPQGEAPNFAPGEGDIYSVDPRNPLDANSPFQTNATATPILSGFDRLMGITFDDENNMYFVEQTVNQANSTIHKYEFNGTMWVEVSTVDDNTRVPRREGFFNAWGITWSGVTDELLVTSFSEDCIARVDADNLTYLGPAIPHVPGAVAKAIGIVDECCYRGPFEIDVDICDAGTIRLRDAIDCGVCTGVFDRVTGTGGEFDECTQTFTADANTTDSQFTFTDNNQACGPVTITVNLNVIEAFVDAPLLEAGEICSDADPLPLPSVVRTINEINGEPLEGEVTFNLIVGTDTAFNQTTLNPRDYPINTELIVSVNFDPEEAIGPCVVIRDFPIMVSPNACCPFVDLMPAGSPICSVDSVELAGLIDSIFINEDYTYTWTTNGDGTFNGDDPDGNPATGLYPSAMNYIPGPQDANTGRVTLTLSSTDGDGDDVCTQRSDDVVIDLLKVGCGVFNWDGTDR